jgi:hypothetical protein
MINSARFAFAGVTNPGPHSIALLAPDRPDVPAAPSGVQFASIWHGDFDTLGESSIGVTVRYDDTFSPGIAAGNVQLWTYDQGTWDAITSSNLDVADRLLSATIAPTDWLAVSSLSDASFLPQGFQATGPVVTTTTTTNLGIQVPEPASGSLLLLTGAALVTRRRRRSR